MPELASLPDIDAARAILDGLEANQTEPQPEPFQQSEPPAEQTQPEVKEGTQTPDSKSTDTPATASDKPTEQKPSTTPEPKPKEAEKGSAFARDRERLDKTWKSVNERKAQLEAREAELKQRETTLASREQQIKVQAAKAQNQYTPEQYEQAASNNLLTSRELDQRADGLEAQAKKLEENGDYLNAARNQDQAKQLREEAAGKRFAAGQMRNYAQQLRTQPQDQTLQQYQAQKQKELSHYTVEAAKQWSELGVKGSQFQVMTAEHLKQAAKYGLDANEVPAIMYFAAEMTAHRLAAARVPEMEKELGTLRARVKELETKTAPGGGKEAVSRAVQNKPTQTDDQEESELRSMALAMS